MGSTPRTPNVRRVGAARLVALIAALVVLLALDACSSPSGLQANIEVQGVPGAARTVTLAGSSSLNASPAATAYGVQDPEFSPLQLAEAAGEDLGADAVRAGSFVNRTPVKRQVPFTAPSADALTPQRLSIREPSMSVSFHGLDHFDQRFANDGNQFSIEPPDQALCVGNGYVLESVNDVIQVYDADGNPLTGVASLNEFYGYAPAIDRTTGVYGPSITDPICAYDRASDRFYEVVLTLDVDPGTGNITGDNHLDIAVSTSGNPMDPWNLYSLDVTNDGEDCPCLGDYPHIGVDRNGVYLTTNNFPLTTNGFNGAWIYALSKDQLAAGATDVNVVSFATVDPNGQVGYTVWPASVPRNAFENGGGGTEYFLSSTSVFEPTSDTLVAWAVSNTRTLSWAHPHPVLTSTIVDTNPYGDASPVPQMAGPTPLANALNEDLFGYGSPPEPQVEGPIASNDSRMQQVYYSNGSLWGALTTALNLGGREQAGVAYFVVNPRITQGGIVAGLQRQGYIAVADNNVLFPAVAVDEHGRGVVGMTLVGPDHYPSAAYAALDEAFGAGPVRVAAEGVAPQDGFTEYFLGGDRPRWGDYGAAVVTDGHIYTANEYINSSCTFSEYLADTTCGGTRSALANWGTRISRFEY